MAWIVKRTPFANLHNPQQGYEQGFNSSLPVFFNYLDGKLEEGAKTGKWTPQVDIFENKNEIALEADLPGVKAEDFKLTIENYQLTLSGERKFEQGSDQDNWHRVERGYGSFTRTFRLPTTVDVEAVKAEFKNGVLRIALPKREEVKARQVHIEVKNNDTQAVAGTE